MFKSLLLLCLCCTFFVGDVTAIDQFGASPVAPINPTGMPGMPDGPAGGAPGSTGMQPRQRDGLPPASEAVAATQQEIETQLNTLLAAINQGITPDTAEMAQIAETVKKNLPTIEKTDTKSQANLQLLNAWKNYFSGDFKRARIAANAAYRVDPKNKDAQTTFIMMSIANNEVKNAKATITQMRKKTAMSATAANQQPTSDEFPAVLEFDANSVQVELLDQNIGAFDAACLNGASFSFKGGKTLVMLLWTKASVGTDISSGNATPQPMIMPGMGAMPGQTFTPLQTYGMFFARGFQNNKIAFLGLNLDASNESGDVMVTLMKNPWPWPQAMAQDPRNTPLMPFTLMRYDKPVLVVIGPDGGIKYAGAFSTAMLYVMAGQAQGGSETQLAPAAAIGEGAAHKSTGIWGKIMPPLPKSINGNTVAQTPAASGNEPKEANTPAVPASSEQTPTPKPKAQKSDEETFNPQAQALYNNAKGQMKMAHVTGYGNVVKFCRQILREYPDTPEAAKARQLLREIPERKRAQYKITNEEMGL